MFCKYGHIVHQVSNIEKSVIMIQCTELYRLPAALQSPSTDLHIN